MGAASDEHVDILISSGSCPGVRDVVSDHRGILPAELRCRLGDATRYRSRITYIGKLGGYRGS